MGPFGQPRQRHNADFTGLERAKNKAVPGVFRRPWFRFRDRNKFRMVELLADGIGRKRQDFGLAGIARERERLDESARAIAPVAVIQAQRIARVSEFIHAQAALQARPDSRSAKDLVRAGTDSVSGGQLRYAPRTWDFDMIVIKTIQLGFHFLGQQSLLRAEL